MDTLGTYHYPLMREAYYCAGNHSANRIIRDFYHFTQRQLGRNTVPHILELIASPIVRSKSSELELVFTHF
jgi:hypothetical protein